MLLVTLPVLSVDGQEIATDVGPHRCKLCGKVTKRRDYEAAGRICKTVKCRSAAQSMMAESVTMAPIQQHQVRHLLNGNMVWEPVNLPWCCSVASESYWSA